MNFDAILDWAIINLPFIITIVLFLIFAVRAFKNGFIEELCAVISAIIASVAILLLAVAVHGVFDKERIQFVVAIVLIILLGIVYKLLSYFFTSIKAISKLPVISVLDQILGMLMAVAETVVIVWAIYCVVIILGGGSFGTWILRCVNANPLMKLMYQYNYLYGVVTNLSDKIAAIDIWAKLGM